MADKNNGKVRKAGDMPHSLEAEQSLLGCLMLDTKIQTEILSDLKEEDFFAESHKNILHAMIGLNNSNQTIDLINIADALDKQGLLELTGGIEKLTSLTDIMPSTANYMSYYNIVKRDGMLRKLISGSSEIIEECKTATDKNAALAFAEKTVFDIAETADTGSIVEISEVIPDVMMALDELSRNKKALRGIRTQYRGIDKLLDGLHKSNLVILAARPAVGKTSLAMNIVGNIATSGYSCAVFSLEMSKEEIVQRLICSVANVSMEHASKGEMNKSEWMRINRAKEILNKSKIYIDDSAITTPQQVLSKCRRIKRKYGLDLVMIDYIQLMTADSKRNSDNRQQEITEISRNLKILAKECNVPVLALSQLSRAVETRKGRPQLSDLRESGAIEQDADIVMFIHRPDKGATEKELQEGKVKKNVAEIIIEKNRSGPTGLTELYFKGECTKFLNIDTESGEPESFDGDENSSPAPHERREQLGGEENAEVKENADKNADNNAYNTADKKFVSDEDIF